MLTDKKKDGLIKMRQEFFDCVCDDSNFLENVITGDELWVFEYDPAIKGRSSECYNSTKARINKWKVKPMLIVLFAVDQWFIKSF